MPRKTLLCLLLCLGLLLVLETVIYRHFGDQQSPQRANFRLSSEQAKAFIQKTSDLQIIDVRTKIEFSFHALPNSVNMPLFKIHRMAKTLPSDTPVLIVDLIGARAIQAYKVLRRVRPDLKEIYYLQGDLFDLLPQKPRESVIKKLISSHFSTPGALLPLTS